MLIFTHSRLFDLELFEILYCELVIWKMGSLLVKPLMIWIIKVFPVIFLLLGAPGPSLA